MHGGIVGEQGEKHRGIWRDRGRPPTVPEPLSPQTPPPFASVRGWGSCCRFLLWLVRWESPYLWAIHPFSHQESKRPLQHQRDLLSVQKSVASLQQELPARTGLPQVGAATWAGGLGSSQATLSPGCFVGMCKSLVKTPVTQGGKGLWRGADGGAATCWGPRRFPGQGGPGGGARPLWGWQGRWAWRWSGEPSKKEGSEARVGGQGLTQQVGAVVEEGALQGWWGLEQEGEHGLGLPERPALGGPRAARASLLRFPVPPAIT